MAIGIRIAKITRGIESGAQYAERVVEDEYNSNTADSPTVEDYLVLEAADGYLPVSNGGLSDRLVTADVSAINGA